MRIRSKFLTKLVAWVSIVLLRILFRTCRKVSFCEVPGTSPYEEPGTKRFLYCIWHDQVVLAVFAGRSRQLAGLVSRHQDGSYLADAMEILGVQPVRGSSSRGGARALRTLLDESRHRHIAISPDGPRGPRRKTKNGLIFLASHSGREIVPIALSCRRCWRIQGNWTDMMIPKPFTTVFGLAGRPFSVPAGLDRAGVEAYTERLQEKMDQLDEQVRLIVDGDTGGLAGQTSNGTDVKTAA